MTFSLPTPVPSWLLSLSLLTHWEQFRVNPESVRSSAEGITADIWPGDGGSAPLSLRVRFYENGVCRLKVDEQSPGGAQRWEVRPIASSVPPGFER